MAGRTSKKAKTKYLPNLIRSLLIFGIIVIVGLTGWAVLNTLHLVRVSEGSLAYGSTIAEEDLDTPQGVKVQVRPDGKPTIFVILGKNTMDFRLNVEGVIVHNGTITIELNRAYGDTASEGRNIAAVLTVKDSLKKGHYTVVALIKNTNAGPSLTNQDTPFSTDTMNSQFDIK